MSKYTITLILMDNGSAWPGNCTVVGGACEVAQSAIAAAENSYGQAARLDFSTSFLSELGM